MKHKYGFVYLIQAMDFIKIGYTTDVQQRFKTFDLMFPPIGLKLLGYIESGLARSIEKELHIFFNDKRARGEWFKLSPEDIDYIKGHYCFIETKVIRHVYKSYIIEIEAIKTGREQRVLDLTTRGYVPEAIAERLGISERMVRECMLEMHDKLTVDKGLKEKVSLEEKRKRFSFPV